MRMLSYRTTGLTLIFVAIAAALLVQFAGGGLLDVVDAHETAPGTNGSGGGFAISMVLTPRWLLVLPVVLGISAIVCLMIGANEKPNR
jgi:hypothetical protein